MIEVNNLVKRYGNHTAVDHLSFKIEKGKIYGFLGPNGAGKSTTMNMITGYIASTEGTVKIDGHDILEEPEAAKKCIGYLPEQPPVYFDMTVLEYMKFDDVYVVRLDRSEEIVESLTKICDREKITLATIEGIGAADHAVIGLYNVGEQVYHKTELNGPMEITALTGNVSTMDGKTYLHIHINLCDEKMNVKGGHLNECRISATAEITIRTVNGKVERFYDKDGVGLNLYQFPGNEGYKKLLKNLIDVIKEDHAKLGFRKEKIRLYYPLSSLNHFFGTSDDADQMQERLNHLPVVITEKLGEVVATHKAERFCFHIPEEGSEYVHNNMKENEFIKSLIELLQKHGCKMDDILNLFHKYSDNIITENMDNGEFDILIRFEDKPDDPYYYCFKDEGCHIIYHRFLKEDYEDFGF